MSETVETPVVEAPVIAKPEHPLADSLLGKLAVAYAKAKGAASLIKRAASTDPAKAVVEIRDNPEDHNLPDDVLAQVAKGKAQVEKILTALDALLTPYLPASVSDDDLKAASVALKEANAKITAIYGSIDVISEDEPALANLAAFAKQEGFVTLTATGKSKSSGTATGDGPSRPKIDPIVLDGKTFKTLTEVAGHLTSTFKVKVLPTDVQRAWVAASGKSGYKEIEGATTFDFAIGDKSVSLTVSRRVS